MFAAPKHHLFPPDITLYSLSDVLVLLLLRNFVDLPLVLHFSLDGVRQVLSPRTRVVLSLLSSLLNIARLWRRADLPAADQDDDEDD
jgi:hypothetical protein